MTSSTDSNPEDEYADWPGLALSELTAHYLGYRQASRRLAGQETVQPAGGLVGVTVHGRDGSGSGAGGDIARALDAFLNAATARSATPDNPSLLALVVFDLVLVFLLALVPPRLVLGLVVRHLLPLLEHVGLGLVMGG